MAFCGSLDALFQFPSRSFSPEFKGAKKGSCKIVHNNNNVQASTKTKESSCSRGRVTGTGTYRDRAKWDVSDSAQLYRIEGWGAPYFSVNTHGNVCVRPWGTSDGSDEIDILGLIESLQRSNIKLPMVIRFPDIVLHRIQKLQECFDMAIARYGYQQSFQGVFPIKCNHDSFLIKDIIEFGHQFKFGLEVGSKPELLIAVSKLCCNKDALLICNGYKDSVYIESALLAMQLGIKVVLVLEQMEELDLVIKTSRKLKVLPIIGLRAKLSTKHDGHWAETSGDSGKFGLSVSKLIQVVHRLKKENMLQCLQLLHFHIGSQIPSISTMKETMREGSHIYCELVLMGARMHYIDVGGGLGIDYDGTGDPSNTSISYSMQCYANEVVVALRDACLLKGVSQPVIVSESGRALASHHSVIVFDVLSVSQQTAPKSMGNLESLGESRVQKFTIIDKTAYSGTAAQEDLLSSEMHAGSIVLYHTNTKLREDCNPGECLLSTFYDINRTICQQNFQEAYNDAKRLKREAHSLFKLGYLSLEHRAQVEAVYDAISFSVLKFCKDSELPDELDKLKKSLAATYHINLSVFRSVPDSWAINQVFPIMPLHRLHEKPNTQATLADLTCDSDGKIEHFIGPSGNVESVLSVHHLCEGEPYYMGLFLAGVYQEILGSAHNLFGAINVIHVRSKASDNVDKANNSKGKGQYSFERIVWGQTTKEVLHSIRHNVSNIIEDIEREAESAVSKGCLSIEGAKILLENYKCSLDFYTYLSK